ncbi:hypothetical protein UFOVP584_36 [uncultured Caudovirales phage]|uniref:Uncharacterized protein n=1 Tax=uncultured Caudovirales phage TaxID=2100421 RepID=A0A6J5LT99_9CAUD|nr:hypothetical protein UFOVP304_9 [uncultured Caudovirales phage]CAB4151832.1 hypothetical protein UFOVP584_36 [uncultured Caudovirales phage]
MSTDLYTIDKTPSTDLEKFQALRIEALENALQQHKEFIKEIQVAMENYTNNIEVIEFEKL